MTKRKMRKKALDILCGYEYNNATFIGDTLVGNVFKIRYYSSSWYISGIKTCIIITSRVIGFKIDQIRLLKFVQN